MLELNLAEMHAVHGAIIAAAWNDGDYFVRYNDGSVQQFGANDSVTFFK
ncbi:MAG: hypothetical protein HYZ45_04370 [Burkholderiales bacterium]|nr:hypothetical protein [Burkholderiales bacterium]